MKQPRGCRLEKKIMEVTTHLITGMMVGFEVVPGDENWKHCLVIDLFIVRIMFHWGEDGVDS